MSEYQYYEFQALDRRLSDPAMAEMHGLSSRAHVTATSASFVYNYGDFRGDPKAVLAKHFDAMLYMANWDSRRLMFRFPQELVNGEALEPYCVPDSITLEKQGNYLILDIHINEEEGEWIDTGEGRLTGMIPLRDAILAGDYRALYLAWLSVCELGLDPVEDWEDADDAAGGEDEEEDDEAILDEDDEYPPGFVSPSTLEPPVPSDLKNLNGALEAFIEFIQLDPLWVEVAAEGSASARDAAEPLEQWIRALPEEDCRRLLMRAVGGEPNIALVIRKELRERFGSPAQQAEAGTRRTAGELAALVQKRRRRAAEEKRCREAQAHKQRMEALAPREAAIWDQVMAAIEQRTPKGYDQAVSQLRELRELAEYRGTQAAFQERLATIVEQFNRLSGLRSRLSAAGLLLESGR